MRFLAETYGDEETEYLFGTGPRAILAGERAE
jgi:hypothetical protein